MEEKKEVSVERKGSMLEGLVEKIFLSAGFEVYRNTFLRGFEVDVLVSFGDKKLLVECKQYEKSYLPVKNLILQWKGKNEIIEADGVILAIYGVEISEEDYNLAKDSGIQIWGMDKLNYFLTLINEREVLCSVILQELSLKERDIAETNEEILKKIIMETLLTGGSSVPEEKIYGIFRKALRSRIITNLKEHGSTVEIREKHIYFFENVIKDIEIQKILIFKFKNKLSNKEVWYEIRTKLNELKPFEEEQNLKYLDYMKRLDEGYDEYFRWFIEEPEFTHQRLIAQRILNLEPGGFAKFIMPGNRLFEVGLVQIKLDEAAIADKNILEWILTDLNYEITTSTDQSGKCRKELSWYPGSFEEMVDYACRLLHEYYGMHVTSKLIDSSLTLKPHF